MNDIIKKHRQMVALRMSQGFQLPTAYQGEGLTKGDDEYNDIEKARVVRQDGDIHPNGKWVWVSSAAGGKGDWRVIKKQKGDNPAPAAKPAEGGAPKKSKLQDKVEGMSLEELEALQKMVAQAMAKKSADVTKESSEKMQEGFKNVLAQGIAQKNADKEANNPLLDKFRHLDKKTLDQYKKHGFFCDDAWEIGDGNGEVMVAKMTDEQKQKTWPDGDYEDRDGSGEFAVIYPNEDHIEFFETRDEALRSAKGIAKEYLEKYEGVEDDDDDVEYEESEDDVDGEGDELAYIASIVSKYEEGAEVEGVDIRDFGDAFLDFVTTSGEAACIKNDYLGDAVIVPLFDNEEIVEHNKSILGIKSDLKGGYALFIGNNPPEFYKTIKEAAQWAGEAIKDGYYEQNYDEDGNELAKPKPNKPKLGEAPMVGAAEKMDEFISHIQSKYEGAKISKDGDIVDVEVPIVDGVKIDIQFNPSVGSVIADWSGFGRSRVTSYESNVRNMSVGDLVPPVTSFIDKLIAKQRQIIAFNSHRLKSSKKREEARRDTDNAKEAIRRFEQLRKKYASAK